MAGRYNYPSMVWALVAFTVALALTTCGQRPAVNSLAVPESSKDSAGPSSRVRAPAVAGLFYPGDKKELSATIERLLAAAPTNGIGPIKALICPHAGYIYSGPTAAHAYKMVAGGPYETVVILAASHSASFQGVSIPASDAYETPLGQVEVSPLAAQLAKQKPFVLEPRCYVQRPPWAAQGPKPAPPLGEDTPETWEHSVEVQVPFLQKTLRQFKILPVVFGDADPQIVAQKLADILDDKTLIIASTDLSHYHPYDEAKKLDRQTVKWICDMDIAALQSRDAAEAACGRMPVLALLHLAKLKGWGPQQLDYRNSGDTAGDKRGVVGYTAIAFCSRTNSAAVAPAQETDAFSAEEQRWLLGLARETLSCVVTNGPFPSVAVDDVPPPARRPKGCFVTLTENGQLRGCIGNIVPEAPVYRAVMQNAQHAALHDHRFPPVTPDEVKNIHIEVSVLTEPRPLVFQSPDDLLAKLQPRQDGVLLKINERGATFLPQVWEQLPDKVTFLNHLTQKAGCEPGAWRGKDVSVSTYHVEAFSESK